MRKARSTVRRLRADRPSRISSRFRGASYKSCESNEKPLDLAQWADLDRQCPPEPNVPFRQEGVYRRSIGRGQRRRGEQE